MIKSSGINLGLPSPRLLPSLNDGKSLFAMENITISERTTAERIEKTMDNLLGKTLLNHENIVSFNTWEKLPLPLQTVFTGTLPSLIFAGCSLGFNFFNLDVFQKKQQRS